jgi:hypothetical protein
VIDALAYEAALLEALSAALGLAAVTPPYCVSTALSSLVDFGMATKLVVSNKIKRYTMYCIVKSKCGA